MINKKRIIKRIVFTTLIFLLVGNFIIYNQAYRFTHFSENDTEKTKRPEELGIFEKIGTLFLGINIPKPRNEKIPNRDFETIILKSHEELEAWHIKIPEAKGTIILFHGYAASKSSMLSYSEKFNEKGYSTFLVDFMGSGGSSGNETSLGFKESRDVKVAYEYIRNQNQDKEIVLFGTSMGAVSIMKSFRDYGVKPNKIILECPFGTMVNATKKRFEAMNVPSFPLAEILLVYGGIQLGFNPFVHKPVEYAKNITIPTLLLYGAKDERVSREEIDKIYKNLNGDKELVIMENSAHEIYLNDDKRSWNQEIDEFLLR